MSNKNNIAPTNEDLNVEIYKVEEIKRKIYDAIIEDILEKIDIPNRR